MLRQGFQTIEDFAVPGLLIYMQMLVMIILQLIVCIYMQVHTYMYICDPPSENQPSSHF